MTNELLIILSFIVIYGGVALFYRLFGKGGLLAFSIFATLVANIEVLLLVDAFGRKDANRAVLISTACSILFIAISQIWLLYTPAANDWASPAFHTIFSNTPRLIIASLSVYLVSQLVDVWLYHKWWNWCRKRFGDSRKGLWIRNNGSTMLSQLLNTSLFTFIAFYGVHPFNTLVSIFASSYAIFIVTSLIDTPIVYWCRSMHERGKDGLKTI